MKASSQSKGPTTKNELIQGSWLLPADWKWVKLKDVTETVEAVRLKEKDPNSELIYLDIGGIDNKANRIHSYKSYKWKDAPSRAQQIVYLNDVLFSTVRTYMKNIAVVENKQFDGQIASSGFCVIRANKKVVASKYIFYYSISESFLRPLNELQTGSSYPAVRDKDVFSQPFPLPPLKIQESIVSKIEELFSELDKGIESLKLAQQQLKVYRQAVLKWAFEGRLTNGNVKEGELPEGWKWEQLKNLVSILGDGLHGTPKYTDQGDYYFINGNNLSNGKILLKEATKRVSKDEYEKYKKPLNEKTILVSINGTLGNTAFYNNENVILGKSACFFNVLDRIDKHYIRLILIGQRFINYAIETATGSTIPNVSLKAMREFEIPVAPIEEQANIIQEIEYRLSVADKMEESINQSLLQAEVLRQSILKTAFEGKLV